MIDNSFIINELGVRNPYPNDLLEISTKFTIAFYYCEKLFFDTDGRFANSGNYACKILRLVEHDCNTAITTAFEYFRDRYTGTELARLKLQALTTNTSFRDGGYNSVIETGLNNLFSNNEQKLVVCLMVIIRLRHNLLHANKYDAMLNDSEEQLILLTIAYDLLADLLLKTNNRAMATT